MNVCVFEADIGRKGSLELHDLPFAANERVEVIILKKSIKKVSDNPHRLWGKPVVYEQPYEPVSVGEWEVERDNP
ncbi:MAG: hypothetical protein EOL87_18205 [Spartobacteria bacterium]|nr:hypothetical protein [Spartobacteria bacterium]